MGAGIFEIVSVVLGLEDGYFELGSGVVVLYFELKLCAHCLSGSGVVELYFELKLCFNCLCGSGLVELYFELGSGVVELSAGISDLFAEMRKTWKCGKRKKILIRLHTSGISGIVHHI